MILLSRGLVHVEDESRGGRLRALRRALQAAIELEHSTIPPYLYALYSIKTDANLEVARLLRSVVLEEMLHMSLDCNILNAIGGEPSIDHPKFIPTYPGPLPGSVDAGLIVPLAPLSKQLVHDVFMAIEEPEHPLAGGVPPPPGTMTIGEFYGHIRQQIIALGKDGPSIFTGDPARQLRTGFAALQTAGVVDEASALAAIALIVAQGEGTATSPLDPEHALAHYYKYAEIYHGRKLIPDPAAPPSAQPSWVFAGHRIAFDPAGVEPVIANPTPASYAPGSRLADLNDTFNAGYSVLLRRLHQVFNGQPDWLGPALLGMQALKAQAQELMSLEVVPGQTAGPTFTYLAAGTAGGCA